MTFSFIENLLTLLRISFLSYKTSVMIFSLLQSYIENYMT